MKKKTQTTTKAVETVTKEAVKTTTETTKKSNTNGIKNLNTGLKKKSTKPAIYKLCRSGGKDKRGKVQYPVVYMIKAEDIIYDPAKDINRKIRYIPGEASIFEDEQKDDAQVKSPITFSNGYLMVDRTNPTLKKYLDHSNLNKSNPNRSSGSNPAFELVNHEVDAKKKIDKVMNQLDAVKLALDMPLTKLIAYAKILGVNVNKSTDEIRYDMKMKAEKDPSGFITGVDNPTNEVKEIINNAMDYNILSLKKNQVCWKDGAIITHVPLGIRPMDHMAQFCMSEKGNATLEHIKLMLDKLS